MAEDAKRSDGQSAVAATAAGPLSPTARQRLQKLFEHAQRSAEKKDFDYAHELYAQCVVGDPASIIYLQSFFDNLKTKYNNNKKGSKLAGLKTSAGRKNIKTATGKKDWTGVLKAGCEVLKFTPWDPSTLMAMAGACEHLGIDECQLYYLRWALNADPKNSEVNKQAALTLTRMGQFDQAIACWHRVEEVKPGDEEAAREISRLTVEKAVHHGGYDRELIGGQPREKSQKTGTAAKNDSRAAGAGQPTKVSREQFLRDKLENDPSELANYFELAKLREQQQDFAGAEELLDRALAAAGGGDLSVRERIEDLQMRHARQQLAIAQKRAAESPTDEANELVQRLKAQVNQGELEVYAARVDRDPKSKKWQYELGVRLKAAGKYRQAIETLETACRDPEWKAPALLETGECFQYLEEYDLALSKYRAAIDASKEASDTTKRALYRAGVLSTGLREFDQAAEFLSKLAQIDPAFRDVSARLDKVERLRHKD